MTEALFQSRAADKCGDQRCIEGQICSCRAWAEVRSAEEQDRAKPAYNRHKVAVEVQDAVNLRALAREFVKVVDHPDAELRSTKAVWEDPAVVLFVNKFESLCRSDARFSEVYRICQEKSAK